MSKTMCWLSKLLNLICNAMNIFEHTVAEISVTYSNNIPEKDCIRVTGSQDVFNACRSFWPSIDHVEYFYILLLNFKNKILGCYQVSKGGIQSTVTDMRVIFQVALKAHASAIIAVHNHPGGDTIPSDADKSITKKMSEAGKFLDIKFLDHLIITSESFYSFADNGEL